MFARGAQYCSLLPYSAFRSPRWRRRIPTHTRGAPPNGAARGDAVAMAMQYENGLSVPRDYGRALTLYCEAARRGDPRAFYGLGWMYLNGRGVARDDAIAVMWLHKAADRGIRAGGKSAAIAFPSLAGAGAGIVRPLRQTPRQAVGRVLPLASAPPAIRSVIDETAQHLGINGRLLHSVVLVESGFNPHAVSPKMAAGLMQLMPATAARFGVHDRFDPRENVRAGAKYLRLLIDKYKGNLTLALAAYNAGEEKWRRMAAYRHIRKQKLTSPPSSGCAAAANKRRSSRQAAIDRAPFAIALRAGF